MGLIIRDDVKSVIAYNSTKPVMARLVYAMTVIALVIALTWIDIQITNKKTAFKRFYYVGVKLFVRIRDDVFYYTSSRISSRIIRSGHNTAFYCRF